MGITTKDLAQMCGVSRMTVHRALTGVGRINPDTKEMILRMASEHDYRPDLLARGLVKGKTYNIGIVVLDVENRYFSKMISTIGAEMNRRGYCMNIMLHGENRKMEKEQLQRLASFRVDGIILSSVNEGEEYSRFLKSLDVPIVSVDNKIAEDVAFVGIDQRAAMREVAQAALERGYRRLVYVRPPLQYSEKQYMYVHRERLKGFEDACAEYADVEKEYVIDGSGYAQIGSYLDAQKRTAFLCASDSYALEIMKTLRAQGKIAARDYGITGFDNIDTLDYVQPRLQTVSNAVEEVAVEAVGLLFEMIEQKEKGAEQTGQVKILPHRMIAGETV